MDLKEDAARALGHMPSMPKAPKPAMRVVSDAADSAVRSLRESTSTGDLQGSAESKG